MQPRELSELRKRRGGGDEATEDLRRALGDLGEVRPPAAAEEPILAPNTRRALHGWLSEINASDELAAAGLRPRTTALLYGPPGTGKTTFAHHLAARLGLPMVLVGSENLSAPYMGQSEQNTAKLFNVLMRLEAPCVVLIDELEAIGGHRNKNKVGGADNARTAMLGVLLRKVEEYRGILLGATNREADIDPALWRRFGLQVSIDLPGEDERFAILRRYLAPFEVPDEPIDILTDLTAGASPALLRGLAEGLKRTVVLGPRTGRMPADAAAAIREIIASLNPPPEIDPPPLWRNPARLSELTAAGMPWPLTRTS